MLWLAALVALHRVQCLLGREEHSLTRVSFSIKRVGLFTLDAIHAEQII